MKSKFNRLVLIALILTANSCTKKNAEEPGKLPPNVIEAELQDTIGSPTDTIAYINHTPNATEIIRFKNYLGNTENIHPKVLYFEKGWKGYKFWMAYTPYPKGEANSENPCIAVSQDGINWILPKNFTANPLDVSFENGYNSDTHLVYRKDLDIIECWYRPYNTKLAKNAIYRRVSSDGMHWQARETIIDFNGVQMLSPAINFEDNKYKIWYCYDGQIRYIESLDSSGKNWPKNFQVINSDWSKFYPWHLDVIKTEKGYEMIVCAWDRSIKGANNNSADLFYCSTDSKHQTIDDPHPILKRSTNKSAFDFRSIYRASFIKVNNKYYIYYSAISDDWTRSMALSFGSDINNLHGYVKKSK
ncbi:hypothetical protein [Sphingobacterium sp. UBA5670]|uniref:hypothetical protein n=1 Tax=Sphingobacterium sp. UBA5670 TaxID=1947502 RepID=UPI0025DDF8F9|nr:hypothetical protein [Sphingobacterium sp. UBA5670]